MSDHSETSTLSYHSETSSQRKEDTHPTITRRPTTSIVHYNEESESEESGPTDEELLDFDERKNHALELLESYFGQDISQMVEVPEKESRSLWKPPHQYWFLYGVVTVFEDVFEASSYTPPQYADRLAHIESIIELFEDLVTPPPSNQSPQRIKGLIHELYSFYIHPFKQHGAGSSSHSSSNVDLSHSDTHKVFVQRVTARDMYCLFCFKRKSLVGCHILRQGLRNIPVDLPRWFGVNELFQVQNGILLCNGCHGDFDKLWSYVDVENNQYFVEAVKFTNSDDVNNEAVLDWIDRRGYFVSERNRLKPLYPALLNNRQAEVNGRLPIYFYDTSIPLPNINALLFRKAATLIWRMAGGADPIVLKYWDDDEDMVVESGESLSEKLVRWDSGRVGGWEM